MKIVSWNVNGLRAVLKKGFLDFIAEHQPDILGIQETKLQLHQIPEEIKSLSDYQVYWSCADRAGYSGTALFIKKASVAAISNRHNSTNPVAAIPSSPQISYSIGDPAFDGEGRIIQADFPNPLSPTPNPLSLTPNPFTLFNIYFPNGQMNPDRLDYKLRFYDQFLSHIENVRAKNLSPLQSRNIIVMGDFNTAHHPIDLAHPKANEKYSGFLPIEREWLDKLVAHSYIDTFRHFDPSPHKYSWWSYMGKAREKNVGWRIDYIFVNSEFIDNVRSAFILPEVYGSDHCPVGIEITI